MVIIIVQREDLSRLARTATMPYAYLDAAISANEHYVLERLLQDREGGKMQFWSAVHDNNLALAAASIQGWDTQQLGMGCASLEWPLVYGSEEICASLLGQMAQKVREWCRYKDITLLSCKIDCGKLLVVHGLEEWGMRVVDCELIWAIDPQQSLATKVIPGVAIENIEREEVEGVADLGRFFKLDRLHADFRIGDAKADALWGESLKNACRERADQVVIATANGQLIGVVTCFLVRETEEYLAGRVCDLVHVVVDPAWRGKGVGKAMITRAVAWARNEAKFVQVGTQARNYAANALYHRMGFDLVHSQYSMHGYWP
ncbi:MAG: GNAT family N-acetyltransferase [Candidatus Latescibacterota bacterium]